MKALEGGLKKYIGLRLSVREYERVAHNMRKTPYRSLSEYARKMILRKPVTVYYRNRSYDEFTEAYISFKKTVDVILEKDLLTEMEKH